MKGVILEKCKARRSLKKRAAQEGVEIIPMDVTEAWTGKECRD